jgi:hypothetical protein
MNTTALLLLLSVPAQNQTAPAPQFTTVAGEVVVEYDGRAVRAIRGAAIGAGSRITTGPGAQATVYWRPGLVVYLDQRTSIILSGQAADPLVSLGQGGIRIVAANSAIIVANQTRTAVRKGVVRLTALGPDTTITGEKGEVWTSDLSAISRAPVQVAGGTTATSPDFRSLSPGQSIAHQVDAGFTQSGTDTRGGESRFEQLQLLAVAMVSRQQRADSPPPPPLPDSKKPGETQTSDDDPTDRSKPGEGDDPPTDDTTRGAGDFGAAADDEPTPADSGSGTGATLALGTSGINLALGNVSLSTAAGGAGGLFTDANQATNAGMLTAAVPASVVTGGLAAGANFPGNIHPVTSETVHAFDNVDLVFSDNFPLFRQFWSVGEGSAPTGQVSTGINTGTGTAPQVISIPGFDNYLVRLDQFGITDPASATIGDLVSISGLVGADPVNPNIQGATPLLDERSAINDGLTFALGEFAVDRNGTTPQLVVRRSDQDRQIVKDPGGNDANDQVTANPQVAGFEAVVDNEFFPSNDSVFIPDRSRGADLLTNRPSFGNLNFLRKAAATTLMADQLFDFAQRTGQTRFVVDGKILDISGFQR